MAKLITGGTGIVGSETARQLVDLGEEVLIFDININPSRIQDIQKNINIIRGDLGNFNQVANVCKTEKIDTIYHMGSMLTKVSEINPWGSFQTNIIGTYNILEAARIFDIPKILFASSRGTFGLSSFEVIDDWTLQRPATFYGCGKLYCEGIGRWYSKKFGLDFRAVRYPTTIAPNVRAPGHYIPPMIEDAILGKKHICRYISPESKSPLIYIKDAAKAAIDLMDASKDKINTQNYNVTGVQRYTPIKEIGSYLSQRHPGFVVVYSSDAPVVGDPKQNIFSDDYAKKEWNWQPDYPTLESIVEQFEKDFIAR